jgi:hypothetical protein
MKEKKEFLKKKLAELLVEKKDYEEQLKKIKI